MLTLPKYKVGDKVQVHYAGDRWHGSRDEEHEVVKSGPKWLTVQVSKWHTERFSVRTGRVDRGVYSPREGDPYVTTPAWEAEKAARRSAEERLKKFQGFHMPYSHELSARQMNRIADILEENQ